MPHLDVYNEEGIDEGDYEALSPEARAAAEREMRKRDRQDDLVHGRARPALLYGECVTACVYSVLYVWSVCMWSSLHTIPQMRVRLMRTSLQLARGGWIGPLMTRQVKKTR